MSVNQRQIMELSYKVDQLYQIVERISKQIVLLHPEQQDSCSDNFRETTNFPDDQFPSQSPVQPTSTGKSILPETELNTTQMEHKDILDDRQADSRSDNNSHHPNTLFPVNLEMSYKLQIQRLTAQLTAAYHRIAALEEQLLAKRSEPKLDKLRNYNEQLRRISY
jgi:hypothetical protein